MKKKIIMLFRRDFRMIDNPALYEAVKAGQVLPVYIYDPQYEGEWALGAASRWWLHYALSDLQQSLQSLGTSLIVRKGQTTETLLSLLKQTEACAVYMNRRYEPYVLEQDQQLIAYLENKGVEVKTFEAHLLLPPWKVSKAKGDPYKVFTAFYKAFQKEAIPLPYKKIVAIESWTAQIPQVHIQDLLLLPSIPWTNKMEEIWDVSERGAWRQFKAFFQKGLPDYEQGREFPSLTAHSLLSPYLAFGQISPRYLFHYLLQHAERNEQKQIKRQIEAFIRQLVWREFSWHLLYHFPHTTARPLNEKFTSFKWEENEEAFSAWTKGLTGYPLIDAGMRELWATGFMHNRVRMAAGSFLVKHLLLPWQKGASWFWDTLVDADLGNNTLGWQWIAGSGADAAPYFRIFNPTIQAEKFDPNGEYIRKWLPELQALPNQYIHKPWEAPEHILQLANITLGISYPYPIVDHRAARERALEHYKNMKN